jgi:predicted acylesterase/phospholipase RssA
MSDGRINAILDPVSKEKIIVQIPFPPINCLAIEGGGGRCTAYVGAQKVLERTGFLRDVVHVSATSGGTIQGLAIALGYTAEQAERIVLNMDLKKFLEGKESALSASSLIEKGKTFLSIYKSKDYSLSSGIEFLEWLQRKVERKMVEKTALFSDLANLVALQNPNEHKYKYLYITGTKISVAMPEYVIFSHETTPKVELAFAAFLSSCIPGVFPAVFYDGHYWYDGGIMNNLPTKLFDEKKYLPKGYGFTDKGTNPGVLALKIDTQEEIDQTLWGIYKTVDVRSPSQLVTSLYTGLAENTDQHEVRSRLTLALPDNKIGSFEFSVTQEGKLGLISSAEKETENFLENHYNAAYDIKVYKNKIEWLDSLSLDEFDDLIYTYEKMLKENEKFVKINKQEIEEYLVFLCQYLSFRIKLRREPGLVFQGKVPAAHVDIYPLCDEDSWSKNIERGMKGKLKQVNKKIDYLDACIQSMEKEFCDLPEINQSAALHHDAYFYNVRMLTSILECQRILYEEKKDLRVKLGLFKQQENYYSKKSSQSYSDLMQILNPLLNVMPLPGYALPIMPPRLSVFQYESSDQACNEAHNEAPLDSQASNQDNAKNILMIDLHDELDRLIYLVAAVIYLNYSKLNNNDLFVKLYGEVMKSNSKYLVLPNNFTELGEIFAVKGVELLVTAYRLEELIRLFERKDKLERKEGLEKKHSFSLDKLFGVEKLVPSSWPAWQQLFGADKSVELNQIKEKKNNEELIRLKHMIYSQSLFSNKQGQQDDNKMEVKTELYQDEIQETEINNVKYYKKPAWF